MANRYTQLSTSSFKPLDLNTIMMIPLAKQAQHDQAKLNAAEYASLNANRLEQDAEAVDTRLNEFKQSANEITASLLDRGVDRNTMAKLQELKARKDKEFSQQGLIGNAQANYINATSFVKDLTEKKERQAGWSPARAKAWAVSQVGSFKGTDAGNGKFNSFSGKELDDYVDSNKWINDNIKNVAANIDPIMLRKYGGVGGFQEAWVSGKVKSLDKNKIIKSLGMQAQYDDKLQASLKQSGYFSGEKDPTNIGSYKVVKGNDGRNREVFIPGSRFGAQLQGAADAAAYKETDLSYDFVTDHVGLALMKKGMDEKDANDMIISTNSSLLDVPPVTYDNLKSNFALAKAEVETTSFALRKRSEQLKSQGIDPSSDPAWVAANQKNGQAMIKFNNASSNLNAVNDKANAGANNIQKRRITEGAVLDSKIDKIVQGIPSLGESARGVFSGESPRKDYITKELSKLGFSSNQASLIANSYSGSDKTNKDNIKKIAMVNQGLIFPTDRNNLKSISASYNDYLKENNDYEKKARAYLEDNPAAASYETFDGFANGKYHSVTGAAQKALTDSFNSHEGIGWKMANTGESLDQIREDNPEAKYRVSPTNGYDLNGDPIETLTMVDKDGVFLKSYPITRGSQGVMLQKQVGQSMSNSTLYKDTGARMVKNSNYLRDVSGMGLHQNAFTQGVIPNQELPDGTLPFVVKSRKEDSGLEFFTFYKIDKNEYIKNKKVVKVGNGNQVGGVDQLIDVLDAYQGR